MTLNCSQTSNTKLSFSLLDLPPISTPPFSFQHRGTLSGFVGNLMKYGFQNAGRMQKSFVNIYYSNCANLLLQQSTSNSTHLSCAHVNRVGLGKAKPMKVATPNTLTITLRGVTSKISLVNLRAKVKIILVPPGDIAPLGAVQEVVFLYSTSKAWQRLTCSVRSLRH